MRAFIPVLLLIPSSVLAFSVSLGYNNVIRWNTSNLTYYLDPSDAPGVKDGSTVPTLKACFQAWQDVPCTSLTFTYLGSTTNKNVLPISQQTNGKNELVWITNSAWKFGQEVLGVTMPLAYGDGTIVEADIAFNGYYYKWNTKGNIGWGEMDVRSVAIHEIGHFFGLQHVLYGYSPNDPPTMAPAVDPYGATTTLNDDDKMGVCFLYPKDGYYTCSSDAQCPNIVDQSNSGEYYSGHLTCKNGYCSGVAGISPGSVEFGGVCQQASDCKSPATCQTLDNGMKVCTQSCTTTPDNCPLGFHCTTLLSVSGYWCAPGAKKLAEGEKCLLSTDCMTSFCFPTPDGSGTYCRIACNKASGSCPDGKVCWAASGSSVGGCFPPEQVPEEKKPLDSECTDDQQCKSGVCGGMPGGTKTCLLSCDPEAPFCYSGYGCVDIGGRFACVAGAGKPDGEPCTTDWECASGKCFLQFGHFESFCRTPCSLSDWKCPEGYACVSYGDPEHGWCMPSENKSESGVPCADSEDCITLLCYADPLVQQMYCTQSCIEGWCPEGLVCRDSEGDYGLVCALPVDGSEPVPDNETELSEVTTQSNAGGCNSSTGHAGWVSLVLLAVALRRMLA